MEVCLESFIGGLHVAAVESATLTSIVLTKYEGGELLNNYLFLIPQGANTAYLFYTEKNRIK